jgi:hypothetical protein
VSRLCTIGYEGYATSEWLATLQEQRVETVIDERALSSQFGRRTAAQHGL